MTVSRPALLKAGMEVRFTGGVHTVTGLSGGAVELADVAGRAVAVDVGRLFSDPTFEVVTPTARRAPLPPAGLLDGVPDVVVARARWWERHLVEVITGLPPDHGRDAVARSEYDPAVRSLRQREIAKVAELTAEGHEVALTTLQRLRHRYETRGLWGLVDARFARPAAPSGWVDARLVEAVRRAVAEQADRSTGTVGRLRRRVEQILTAEHGADAPAIPPKMTFYRLVERVAAGKHTFGSARTRASLAKQPPGPFGTVMAVRPGEWMQIDSTPLDVRVVLVNGLVDRVELTWMLDLATRRSPPRCCGQRRRRRTRRCCWPAH